MNDPHRAVQVLAHAARAGRTARRRRLRHRLQLAGLPQAARRRRAQDRQELHLRDAPGRQRRGDRPLHHRARPQPRACAIVAEGVEDDASWRPAAGAGLRPRPGLPDQPSDAVRAVPALARRVARRPRDDHCGPGRARLMTPIPERTATAVLMGRPRAARPGRCRRVRWRPATPRRPAAARDGAAAASRSGCRSSSSPSSPAAAGPTGADCRQLSARSCSERSNRDLRREADAGEDTAAPRGGVLDPDPVARRPAAGHVAARRRREVLSPTPFAVRLTPCPWRTP